MSFRRLDWFGWGLLAALFLSLLAILSASETPTLTAEEKLTAQVKWLTFTDAQKAAELAQMRLKQAQDEWTGWVDAHKKPGYVLDQTLTYQPEQKEK